VNGARGVAPGQLPLSEPLSVSAFFKNYEPILHLTKRLYFQTACVENFWMPEPFMPMWLVALAEAYTTCSLR